LFKKQSIFFKKTNNKGLFLLNFLDSFKYDDFNSINEGLNKDLIINNNIYFYNLDFIKLNDDFKKDIEYVNFDYRYKINKYVNSNRNILLSFFKFNLKRQFKKNKFISKLIKLPFNFFLQNFEFSLFNILLRSSFFFNQRDVSFFLKNNFFFVNGQTLKNLNYIFNINDIFMMSLNKYYFFYYKFIINSIYNNNTISNYIFKKNKNNNLKKNPL
jgi:hypothetical protein